MSTVPRTSIEFIDVTGDPKNNRCHKAREVRINGVPVLVKQDNIYLDFSSNNATEITLTILPSEVIFASKTPYEPNP